MYVGKAVETKPDFKIATISLDAKRRRLDALVEPPPQEGVHLRSINPIHYSDAVNLPKMANVAADKCRLIRQCNTGDQKISASNLPIRFVGTQSIKLLRCRLIEWHHQHLREQFFSSCEPLLRAQQFPTRGSFQDKVDAPRSNSLFVMMVVPTTGSFTARKWAMTCGWPAWRWVSVSVSSRCITNPALL